MTAPSNKPLELAAFMRMRGYPEGDPLGLLRRLFLSSWAEPGFHRFWRVWNPVYGFFLFRLYVLLGGKKRPALSTLLVFVFCGFALHDLPVILALQRPFLGSTFAFLIYGLCTIASRLLERRLNQPRWPTALNVILNLTLVAGGLALGNTLALHVLS